MQLSEQHLKFIFQKHKLEYVKKLGSGGFGTVYLVNSIGQQFLPLAVKCITKKQIAKRPTLQKYLTQQINSMHSLKHPNIVKLVQTFVQEESIFIVMQYCEYGNLYSYQYSLPEKVFKFDEACRTFLQILKGLRSIHQQNIIHRDLKCQNILLKRIPKKTTYICKIGDFGFAKQLSQTAKSQCGTPNFMAPEILSEKNYDKSVDVWSMGVIMYYMLIGDYPFKGMNLLYDIELKCSEGYDLLRQINQQLIRKKNRSLGQKQLTLLTQFFGYIFVLDPSKRLNVTQLLKLPLFKQFENELQNVEGGQIQQQLRLNTQKKIEFVDNVENIIKVNKILNSQNQLLLKFLLLRVTLWIFSSLYKDFQPEKEQKLSFNTRIQQYRKVKIELEKMIALKQVFGVPLNQAALSGGYQKFQSFKDLYRTFLGYVFSQVHNSTHKQKERLKIRVLGCHTINRIFEDPNSKYFLIFNNWAKSKLKDKKAKNYFDFELFSKWADEQTQQNISKTISAINDHFYTKK